MAWRALSQRFCQNRRLFHLSAENLLERRAPGADGLDVHRRVPRLYRRRLKTSTFFGFDTGHEGGGDNQSEKAFHNAIPRDAFRKAAVITLLAMAVVVLGTWAMALLEPQVPLMDALFEVTSAFGTVGLSTGITPSLGVGAKLLSHSDYVHRQAGAFDGVASLWYFSRGERISYPEGNLSIG